MIGFKKGLGFLLAAAMLFAAAGCTYEPFADEPPAEGIKAHYDYYDPAYYYTVANGVTVANSAPTEEARQKLNEFGDPGWIEAAEPVIEVFTDLPKPENNAKGTPPISYLFPDRDMSGYWGCVLSETEGEEISAYYRVVGGILTDELIKLYGNAAGEIIRVEGINLGKYDHLEQNASLLEQAKRTLDGRITQFLNGSLQGERIAPAEGRGTVGDKPAYALFTDREGNLVVSTQVRLNGNKNPGLGSVSVLLYGVLDKV